MHEGKRLNQRRGPRDELSPRTLPPALSAGLYSVLLLLAFAANAADPVAGARRVGACAACHGEQGISSDSEMPNLAGQKEQYLLSSMRAYRDGSRNHATMRAMLGPLKDQDLKNISAYYAQLKPCPPKNP